MAAIRLPSSPVPRRVRARRRPSAPLARSEASSPTTASIGAVTVRRRTVRNERTFAKPASRIRVASSRFEYSLRWNPVATGSKYPRDVVRPRQAVRRDAQVDPARCERTVDVGELFRGVVGMQVLHQLVAEGDVHAAGRHGTLRPSVITISTFAGCARPAAISSDTSSA